MVERLRVKDIIMETGTPTYIYSTQSFANQLNQLRLALGNLPALLCYSVKGCHNINIIHYFIKQQCGVDIVSGGELYKALQAGANPQKIVYSGVGKTDREIREAIQAQILMFNVESEAELERINAIGAAMEQRVPIALRVNPSVDAKTHPYITTGLTENKFGIESDKALAVFLKAAQLSHVEVIGVDCHIGSQLLDITPFSAAVKVLAGLVGTLRHAGIPIRYVDVGGGLGITYTKEHNPVSVGDYIGLITEPFQSFNDLTFIFEPGRFLTAQAGILVTQVQYVKENSYGKRFVIVDTGMHHLIRPALYGGEHQIIQVTRNHSRPSPVDVVGPICESTDFLRKNYPLEKVAQDELLAVTDCGAYGIVLASHYNSHPLPVEVMVWGDRFKLIRTRETYQDLCRNEVWNRNV